MVADIGVDGVGEVHRRGALGQGHDLGLGREDVDRVREEVDLDVLQELVGVAGFVLDVDQALQPARVGLLRNQRRGRLAATALVDPVRRHTLLGDLVHALGAQLELQRRAQRAHQRGVQRLVAVVLGVGDVVLEAAGLRLVELVQHAESRVALQRLLGQDAKAKNVADLGKAHQALLMHLLVDRVDRLLAALHFHAQAGLGEGGADLALDARDQIAPVASRLGHGLAQRRVAPGVEILEGQVLQLAEGLVQAQPVRDGGVDVEGFAGDAARFVRRHRAHGAHVVQPVRQLHQDDAVVLGHGQEHLP
mmetsp:Transcript_5506/g.9837  ORF Transcript_5506/g.9837 Transcript_5506/m.9837 type:complete len:306 (-) Transcript_5506:234-1151(-)